MRMGYAYPYGGGAMYFKHCMVFHKAKTEFDVLYFIFLRQDIYLNTIFLIFILYE